MDNNELHRARRPIKFLLHTFYATGHVLPMQAIAKTLTGRGHSVHWLTSAAQESRVLASNATFRATSEVAVVDDRLRNAQPTDLPETVDALFGGRVIAQVKDFRRVLAETEGTFDCLLVDALPQGANALFDLDEIPLWVTLGVVPMYLPDEPPARAATSALGMLLSQPELILSCINTQRAQLGLAPHDPSIASLHYSPFLHIQASCEALEFQDTTLETDRPRRSSLALLPQLNYVGPLVTPASHGSVSTSSLQPAWWDEIDRSSCVIGITQGTFAVDPSSLIIPAIEALAGNPDLLLIVPSPHGDEIRSKIRVPIGSNVRIADWVPYDLLLPRCSLLITNGGYGSVTQALSHGVPLITAGTSEDKKDTAARVQWVGAGIDLGTDMPSPAQIRDAVDKILVDPRYKENASKVAEQLNGLGGAEKACDLLEEVVTQSTENKLS
ncbi:MGT family Glycosyltransferase [Phlyctema vagabunda]|uniref:MGT family Glycosyltransferase n=1 Tax=Phlyctema vagabunda TaxID=108571 RepID=A0ABR4P3I4_9HELO